ncbi:DUF4956 domain-containing protein [Candidatus Xianfuyuplasma coldseepsis]|uniref:DUF4956 domain-containing protein n=1 Tax=Candidatus Xianfuyuplasma coldseepsis TaxID=2782163 RepID=A0A7L7KPX8_9MOLU|nr:DUF4956 domain-containing protein [Xianfuyuplasma coldseepsis]QMS84489.1 hypothetical protein G4Z02_01580 [Xianfuyuplasma coldseepsis]
MSFSDLINQDIIDLYNAQNISLEVIVFNIIVVFLLSLLILFTYKKSYQTTVYNRSFAVSLPITAMVTSVIIISVASNIILSLGMVGALSIVRFRTALKNPFDTVFMFWAIGLGITIGAGLIIVAILSTLLIAGAVFLLIYLEVFTSTYFLIVRATDPKQEQAILDSVKDVYKKYTLRNKTVKDQALDLTLEVRSKEDKSLLVSQIKDIESVKSVIVLSHQGDYISE